MDNRLKRQRDFDTVFLNGKRVYSDNLTMIYVERRGGITKIGISISKKHGKAVQRNRIKRLLRAVYLPKIPKIKTPYFIVFMPKICDDYSFSAFEKSIAYLLKKENLINEDL